MVGIEKKRHIGFSDPHVSFCTGCCSCEFVCGLVHEGYTSLSARRIQIDRDDISCMYSIYTCQNCVDAECYEACPLQDEAMCYDEEKEIYYVNPDACTGCGICADACIFEPTRILINNDGVAVKCDLCRDREEGPACVKHCYSMVIGYAGEQIPTAEEGVCYE